MEKILESFENNNINPSGEFNKLCNKIQRLSKIKNISDFDNQDMLIRVWLMVFEYKMKMKSIYKKPKSFCCPENFGAFCLRKFPAIFTPYANFTPNDAKIYAVQKECCSGLVMKLKMRWMDVGS